MKLEDQALAYIKSRGAVTENGLAKGLQIEKPAAREILVSLIHKNKLVWVGALPKQGIFFKTPDTKGYGLPLARKGSAPRTGERASTVKFQRKVHDFVMDQVDPVSTGEVAEGVGVKRDAALRALKTLANQGKIEGRIWKTGLSGRPAMLWGDIGWFDKVSPIVEKGSAPEKHPETGAASQARGKDNDDGDDGDDDWRSVVKFL